MQTEIKYKLIPSPKKNKIYNYLHIYYTYNISFEKYVKTQNEECFLNNILKQNNVK